MPSSSPRLLVIFTLALAVVVGAVAALALGSWWVLIAVLAIHFVASALVVGVILRRTGQSSKPDPVTEARLEEEQEAAGGDGKPRGERDEDRVFGI
jgi:membrane protein implicated in regulation of membrane protease activity